MKESGIIRKIDSLGRITIPIEMCKKMDITRGQTMLEFFTQGEKVILQQEEKSACVFCKNEVNIIAHKGKHICPKCLGVINKKDAAK